MEEDDSNEDDSTTRSGPPAVPSSSSSAKSRPPPQTPDPAVHEVTWGFAEDATEDDGDGAAGGFPDGDGDGDGALSASDDAYYRADPKKALRTWCESHGQDLTFRFEEEGKGPSKVFVASLSLDLDDGTSLQTSGRGGRKREAERNILRSSGSARRAEELRRRRKEMLAELEDDGDGDSFYDRTGDAERRQARREQAARDGASAKPETHDTLAAKLAEKRAEVAEAEAELQLALAAAAGAAQTQNDTDAAAAVAAAAEPVDELDAYIESLKARSSGGGAGKPPPRPDAVQRRLDALRK
ncbi:Kanadaptin, partial [Cladochytrium tenue]